MTDAIFANRVLFSYTVANKTLVAIADKNLKSGSHQE
jgi:hypothetical protein